MNGVELLPNSDLPEWDKFVESHDLGTVYHTSAWLQLVHKAYGYKHIYVCMRHPNGAIRAGLPVCIVSDRVTGGHMSSVPCPNVNPLVANQAEYDCLIDFTRAWPDKCGVRYLELKLRRSFPIKNAGPWPATDDYFTYVLDISRPIDELMKAFHKSCIQRPLLKSSRNGLKLKVENSDNGVRLFYGLYLNMRKEHGLLPQPYKFFSVMHQLMSRKSNIEVLHAEYEGRIVSSLLLLKYKDIVTYEYGASDSAMLHLNPSHFLLWAAIQRAKSEGYTRFDFGRTARGNEGLSQFKARWRGERQSFTYRYIPDKRGVILMRHNKFFDRAMHHTMRNFPALLCRALGRVLYRNLA